MARDTRSALLDAGAELFLRKGYASVGLREILEAADAPKGSFYHFFGSKEDFAVSIIQRGADCFSSTLERRLNDSDRTPLERILFHFEAQVDYMKSLNFNQSCFCLKLGTEMGSTCEAVRRALDSGLDQWLSILANCIREGQVSGEIRKEEKALQLAGILHDLWEGASLSAQLRQSAQPLVSALDHIRLTLQAR